MTTDLLSSLIEELILTSDQVCLPGLGCFRAQLVPASISDRGYNINPPYRKLSFSEELPEQEDNSLAQLYSQKYSVEYARACREVESVTDEIKAELSHSRSLFLKNLGKLRSTDSGKIFFVADIDLDIYPEGFGLQSVSMKNREFNFAAGQQESPRQQEEFKQNGDEPCILLHPVSVEQSAPAANNEPITPAANNEQTAPATGNEQTTPAANEQTTPATNKQKGHKGLKVLLYTILVLLLLTVAAFFIAKEYFPEILDKLLYSAEELELLNNII
ncbi:MAG: hypothetical protein ACI3ZK_08475 [Candidatus Cryptobacteroides sp.]